MNIVIFENAILRNVLEKAKREEVYVYFFRPIENMTHVRIVHYVAKNEKRGNWVVITIELGKIISSLISI